MALAALTLRVTRPWWWSAASMLVLAWCRLGMPMDRDATVAWFAGQIRFEAVG